MTLGKALRTARFAILPRTPENALARGWLALPVSLHLRRLRNRKENQRSGPNILYCL
jgi:hypothetical protein